jgi:hypothetical protein
MSKGVGAGAGPALRFRRPRAQLKFWAPYYNFFNAMYEMTKINTLSIPNCNIHIKITIFTSYLKIFSENS